MRERGILVPLCARDNNVGDTEIMARAYSYPDACVKLPRCVLGSRFHTRQEAVIYAGIPVGACSTLEVVESWNPYLLQFPTHIHFLFFKGREANHCQERFRVALAHLGEGGKQPLFKVWLSGHAAVQERQWQVVDHGVDIDI